MEPLHVPLIVWLQSGLSPMAPPKSPREVGDLGHQKKSLAGQRVALMPTGKMLAC